MILGSKTAVFGRESADVLFVVGLVELEVGLFPFVVGPFWVLGRRSLHVRNGFSLFDEIASSWINVFGRLVVRL